MAILNIASVNTLIRKGYLLAGVIMAANMFIVNEVRAMDDSTKENEKKKEGNTFPKVLDVTSGFVLRYENIINFFGGVVFSGANNYFKLWDYNPGMYCKPVWFGWRSKKFLNNILQFELNLNVVRGILWLIPGAYNFIKYFKEKKEDYVIPLYFSFLVADSVDNFFNNYYSFITALIISFLIQGFVSMPLAIHISNFSISISLDSIIWGGIGMYLGKNDEKKGEEGNLSEINPENNNVEENTDIK